MKMITLANQKRKGFILSVTLALFLSFVCAPSIAADNASAGASASEQQTNRITGKVVNSAGEPIIGANVLLKGSATVGTVTGADGSFSLGVPANATLEVSFIGYETTEIAVGNQTSLVITLTEDALGIETIIKTGFGTGQKKATLTGAISSINSTAIAKSSASGTSGALVGKIAGLNFRSRDGRPGANSSLNIRNMGTPLFIIDGIPSDEGSFNNLDFNDIENIVLLKDASASIYGVRAANGVVVVTTKRGHRGDRNTVSVNAYYGWQKMDRFPDVLDAGDYIKNKVQSDVLGGGNASFTKEEWEKWATNADPEHQSFDWKKFIFISAPQNYVSANVSGGTENSNYYMSISNLNQATAFRNYGGFNRTNLQMNLDSRIGEKVLVGGSINGRIENRYQPGVPGGDDFWLPRFGVFKNLPTSRPYVNNNNQYIRKTSGDNDTNFALLNHELSGWAADTWRVMQITMNFEYDIVDGLKLKGLGSYYYADHVLNNHEATYKTWKYENNQYVVDFHNTNPWRERTTEKVMTFASQLQLSYDKQFGNHQLSAVIGSETESREAPRTWVHAYPGADAIDVIYYPEIDVYDDRLGIPQRRAGFIGKVNYNFSQKYLVELMGRYDGSYLFDRDKRWGFFPAASVGWRVSEENFWKNGSINNVLNDFKVRASYGMSGDDGGISAYAFMTGYTYNAPFPNRDPGNGNRDNGAIIDGQKYTLGSANRGIPSVLTWREAKHLDVGIDFALFNGRLSGQIDYFDRHRTGLTARPGDLYTPNEVGFNVPDQNLNSDRHRGMDGGLTWNHSVGEFSYTVGANFTYSRFYDWNRYKPQFSNSWNDYRDNITHRYGYLNWGYQAIGRFESWEEVANYAINNDRDGNRTVRPGDIKYKDVNGDGIINGMDERPIGFREDGLPILNYGLNLGAQWKGFDFNATFIGASGFSFHQDTEIKLPFQGDGNLATFLANDQWHLEDPWDANSKMIPGHHPFAVSNEKGNARYWKSDFWLHNVKYIKLKNIELGYTLPKAWLDQMGLQQLRFYVSAQNLLTISNINGIGIDPESQDRNGLQYPNPRLINVGVNLKF